jgi:hypothetical protein
MIGRRVLAESGWAVCLGIAAAVLGAGLTFAADLNNIRVADDIVPAPFGYESLTAKYIVAEETPIYLSPYIYPGTVNNDKLKAGQAVDALAKVKDYDWILVGKNGIGIGYIPMSRLTSAKR